MPRRGRPPGATGSVVARALRLLEAFGPNRPALTLSQIARHAGLPPSTAHRLLSELVEWGALERDENGTFWVGLRLFELGALAPRGAGLRERALPFLEDLCQVTRENVQLAVREGVEVVFVERLAGSAAVPVLTRVGGRFALTATGVGLVLLAHAPHEVQEAVLAGEIQRFTEHTVTDPDRIRHMLADVRSTGFSVSDRQISPNALSVAAPVLDARGRVVAAVSLVAHHETAPAHALAPLVRTSARAISRVLGHRPGPD